MLTLLSVTVDPALSGCLSSGENTPKPVDVTVTNDTGDRHEMEVILEFQDDTLLDESFTLQPSGVVDMSFDSPASIGDGVLSVSVDGSEPDKTEINMGAGSGLSDIDITVKQGGTVSVGTGRE